MTLSSVVKRGSALRHKFPIAVPVVGIILLAVLLWFFLFRDAKKAPQDASRPQPVRVAAAQRKDVSIYISALGTAQPLHNVLVQSRVDGQLMRVFFEEGERVRQGDTLAEIDPRPFEVQLKQAEGALRRDQALLKDAKLDLARYRKLVREQSVSVQQLQSQEALVGQYEGTVLMDQAAVDNAMLQLSYCRITAPVDGRLGLRQVDPGNMIRSNDSGGIVSITQTDPMQVLFTIVERDIPTVTAAMTGDSPLTVEAYAQGGETLIATGRLASLDNQVDTATGTVKAKALFDNANGALFPQQFTNIKLLVQTQKNVVVIPSSAVQRDDSGFFVYLVAEPPADALKSSSQQRNPQKKDASGAAAKQQVIKSVKKQEITPGYTAAAETVVSSGLEANDIVVIDGVDRLRDGILVQYTPGN